MKDICLNDFEHDIMTELETNTNSSADELAMNFEITLKNALDKHAPETEKMCTIRTKVPWFTKQVKEQKQILRNHERRWHKYRQDYQWKALQYQGRVYKKLLKTTKIEMISEKVQNNKRDTKHL